MFSAWHQVGPFGRLDARTANNAREALAAVGLDGKERRSIDSLSTAQFQRELFAHLLLQEAKVMILDEPFAAMAMLSVSDICPR